MASLRTKGLFLVLLIGHGESFRLLPRQMNLSISNRTSKESDAHLGQEDGPTVCEGTMPTMHCGSLKQDDIDKAGECRKFYELGTGRPSRQCIDNDPLEPDSPRGKVSCFSCAKGSTPKKTMLSVCTSGFVCEPPSQRPTLTNQGLVRRNSADMLMVDPLTDGDWQFRVLKHIVEGSYINAKTRDRVQRGAGPLARAFYVKYVAAINQDAQHGAYEGYKINLKKELERSTFFDVEQKRRELAPWVQYDPSVMQKSLGELAQHKMKLTQELARWTRDHGSTPLMLRWMQSAPPAKPPDVQGMVLKPHWMPVRPLSTGNSTLRYIEQESPGRSAICENQPRPITGKLLEEAIKNENDRRELDGKPPLSASELRSNGFLLDDEVNEALLFHGAPATKMGWIAQSGLKLEFSDPKGVYGAGLYFAESISKSDEYSLDLQEGVPFRTTKKGYFGRSKTKEGLDSNPAQGIHVIFVANVALGNPYYDPSSGDSVFKTHGAPKCQDMLRQQKCHSVLGDRERARGTFREFITYQEEAQRIGWLVAYERDPRPAE